MERRGGIGHVLEMIDKGHLRGAWTTIQVLIDDCPDWDVLKDVQKDIRKRLETEVKAVTSAEGYVRPSCF